MSKKTRAEKRAEEARIIAEMESAMGNIPMVQNVDSAQKNQNPQNTQNEGGKYAPKEEKIHCKRCKSVMENGVCPVCGFRIYVPMDEKKRKRIRWIVATATIAVFVALLVILRLT